MKNKRFICLTALFLLSALFLGSMAVVAMPGEATKYDSTEGKTLPEASEGGTVMLDKKDAPAATQSATVSLRVGTFNIQNGGGVGHDFSVLAQDILDQGLDVVGLQEVDMFTSRNKGQDTMKALSEATGYKYYGYTKCINLSGVAGVNGGVGEYGTGILSKYPIISYEAVLLPRVSGEQRGYGHAVIEVDGLQFDFYNTHLDWPNKADRTEQFKVFKAIMDANQSAIIVGDLNTEDPAEYRAPFPYCTFANGLKGDPNYYITNHEDGAIDNIIASPNVTIKKTTLVDTTSNRHTDHNMLWADVEITREDAFREENGAVRLYKNGAYLTGWQVYGKSIFYFDPETGAMQKNDLTVDGETYQFEKSTFYGMDFYSLSGDSMPPKNLLPQEWITGLLGGMGPADKELTYAAAHNTRYTADGKEHTPSAFALSLNKFYLQYQFDSEEIDATDYGYTFEIWYRDADKDSEYKFVTLKAERSLKLSNGNILYRLPVYDYGMTDLVTNNNGRTNTYDTVIVIYDGNGAIAGFKQIAIDFTDSSALFLADATK